VSKLADKTPALGLPSQSGPCLIVERIENEVRSPELRRDLQRDVEQGKPLSNPDARKVYDKEVERGPGGWVKTIKITSHAQYRMDLRGINVPELRLAFRQWQKEMGDWKSQRNTKYDFTMRAIQSGKKVEFLYKKFNTFIVFHMIAKGVVEIITVYRPGEKDPQHTICTVPHSHKHGYRSPVNEWTPQTYRKNFTPGQTPSDNQEKQQVLPAPNGGKTKDLGPQTINGPGWSGTGPGGKSVHKDKARTQSQPGGDHPNPPARTSPVRRPGVTGDDLEADWDEVDANWFDRLDSTPADVPLLEAPSLEASMMGKPYPGADRQREQRGPARRYYKLRYKRKRMDYKRKMKKWYRRKRKNPRYLKDQKRREKSPKRFERKPGGGVRRNEDRAKSWRKDQPSAKKTKKASVQIPVFYLPLQEWGVFTGISDSDLAQVQVGANLFQIPVDLMFDKTQGDDSSGDALMQFLDVHYEFEDDMDPRLADGLVTASWRSGILAGDLTFKTQISGSDVDLELFRGAEKVGEFQAFRLSRGDAYEHCAEILDALAEAHPETAGLKNAVMVSWVEITDNSLRGKSVGFAMYQALLAAVYDSIGPFLFLSQDCGNLASGPALRVWGRLRQKYPAVGGVLAVLRAPTWDKRLKLAVQEERQMRRMEKMIQGQARKASLDDNLEAMQRIAIQFKLKYRPKKRQKKQKGQKKWKAKMQHMRNRASSKRRSRIRRKRLKHLPAFKKQQQIRRKHPERFRRRMGEVLTAPQIAFVVGDGMDLGYVRNVSPMTGLVTFYRATDRAEGMLWDTMESLANEDFMASVAFLTEFDEEAMFKLLDVELGLEAWSGGMSEDGLRGSAALMGIDCDTTEFTDLCEKLVGKTQISDMDPTEVAMVDSVVVHQLVYDTAPMEGGEFPDRDIAEEPNPADPYLIDPEDDDWVHGKVYLPEEYGSKVAQLWVARQAEMLYEKRPPKMDPETVYDRGTDRKEKKDRKKPLERKNQPTVKENPGSAKVIPWNNPDLVNNTDVKFARVAALIHEIVGRCGEDLRGRSEGLRPKLKRVDKKNAMWLFDVPGSKSAYRVKVQAARRGNVRDMGKLDVKVSCSCPFWQWQGPEHHAKTSDYLLGKAVGTASRPTVKDPSGKHGACKHVLAVFQHITTNNWQVPRSKRAATRYLLDTFPQKEADTQARALAARYLGLKGGS
jgi:hypothetical protein